MKKIISWIIMAVMVVTTVMYPVGQVNAETTENVNSAENNNSETRLTGALPDKCTGVYVGKDVCKEGTPIIGRSEDQSIGCWNKLFKVVDAEDGENRTIVDTGEGQNNFSVSIPDETYKFTTLHDGKNLSDGPYYAVCMNEKGVAVDATISTDVSVEYSKIDPLKKQGDGIRESILPAIIACQATSAKNGVDVLAKYVDKYGSQETCTTLIQDKKETWMFEIYGGSSYAALRMPTNKMAVFGNQIMIDWVDLNSTDGFLFSKNLSSFLSKIKNPVKDNNGRYNLCQTITPGPRDAYSNMRTWRGHQLFAPSTTGEYSDDVFYSLLFTPEEKVSVLDIMKLFGDRYEGTKYDMSKTENKELRPIGTTRQSDIHIIQTYNDLPDCSCNLQWLALGNAEHAMFVPAFSGIKDTFEAYKTDDAPEGFIDESFYHVCEEICALAEHDRQYLSKGVKEFNRDREKEMYDVIQSELETIKSRYDIFEFIGNYYVTKLCKDIAQEEYTNAQMLRSALTYRYMYNENDFATNKNKVEFKMPSNWKEIEFDELYKQ